MAPKIGIAPGSRKRAKLIVLIEKWKSVANRKAVNLFYYQYESAATSHILMDIFAHGLWTNLVYNRAQTPDQLLAIGLGIAPDALAFGPMLVKQLVTRQMKTWKKVDASTYDQINRAMPRWVFRAYDITHSIPVWLVGFSLWWLLLGSVPWPAFAWLLHILVDIPTHSRKFFPTPFLWPLSSYTFDGINWGVPWFMRLNYGALLVGYAVMWLL